MAFVIAVFKRRSLTARRSGTVPRHRCAQHCVQLTRDRRPPPMGPLPHAAGMRGPSFMTPARNAEDAARAGMRKMLFWFVLSHALNDASLPSGVTAAALRVTSWCGSGRAHTHLNRCGAAGQLEVGRGRGSLKHELGSCLSSQPPCTPTVLTSVFKSQSIDQGTAF